MFRLYTFNFLETVSAQLFEAYQTITPSPLTAANLAELRNAQAENHTGQGVYLLTLNGLPKYVGKANDVAERLDQHRLKVLGRRGLSLQDVGFKAVLLDQSMSTAANEGLLIEAFQRFNADMWNNAGFGPKDPGQNRDNTRPSKFDLDYPVNYDFVLNDTRNLENPPRIQDIIGDRETVTTLFRKMKYQLPYVFRYDGRLNAEHNIPVNLAGVPRTARFLLQAGVRAIASQTALPFYPSSGFRWAGAILHFGMVVYCTRAEYEYAQREANMPLIFF